MTKKLENDKTGQNKRLKNGCVDFKSLYRQLIYNLCKHITS